MSYKQPGPFDCTTKTERWFEQKEKSDFCDKRWMNFGKKIVIFVQNYLPDTFCC